MEQRRGFLPIVTGVDWRSRKLSIKEIIEISSNDYEEEPSIEKYYDDDDDEESSFEVNKKVKVENSDTDYVPSEDAPATPEVNVPFAVKIKDEEEADKLFAEAMEILAAIWKFRQEEKKMS
ncbi:uncharacterized protein A4U43_C05F22150 [Asparagus officinalis]|uniref:Uncharacterized protein n=1 Tax=Asparagus officinalis TaxID=4686 RepID=A0A5P1EYY9_ASPOF|nr:uncharacterized protein A4U43_C05F22150 [Asparagus officinalis]